MRILLFIFLLSPLIVFSQWNYKSRYTQGYYAEFGGLSRGISFNYSRIFNKQPKSFLAGSIGIAYVWGYSRTDTLTKKAEPNPFGFSNSGLAIPVSLMYNYSLGNVVDNLRIRMSRKCMISPTSLYIDWFLEAGAGVAPSFFNANSLEKNRLVYFGYLGIRTHTTISRPSKDNDLVFFLRAGASPFYDKKRLNFSQLGTVSLSAGFGI